MNTASTVAVNVDPTIYFEQFSVFHHLDSSYVWKQERTLQDFPFQAQDIAIIKQGLLYRPSKLGMNIWYPVYAVITATGFFHCFSLGASKHAALIEYYQKLDMERDTKCESGSLQKVLNQKQLAEVMAKPEFSISLALPRLQIQMANKKSGQSIFEIISQTRRSKTMFRKSGEEIHCYEIKAMSEGDMVEWMACLQQNIQNLIPNGPPEPIFKTQQQIEENVEKLIQNQTVQLLTKYPLSKRKSFSKLQNSETTILDDEFTAVPLVQTNILSV